MTKALFIFFIFFALKSFGQETISFHKEVTSDLLFPITHLEKSNQLYHLKDELKLINEGAQSVKNIERLNLIISTEMNKLILNTKFENYISKNIITSTQVLTAQKKLTKNKTIMSEFSVSIIKRILDDFIPFLANNKLDQFQSSNEKKSMSSSEKLLLKRLNKYSSPWISFFLVNPIDKVNLFFNEVAAQFIKNLVTQIKVIKIHSFQQSHSPIQLISGIDKLSPSKNENKAPKEDESNEVDPLSIIENIPKKSRSESINDLLNSLPGAQ